jgi:hypothetical protein
MKPIVYSIPPAIFAPAVLTVLAGGVAVQWSWMALVALPFIWLGSICAQPNLNLANGCFAYVAMFVGLALTSFHQPLGLAIISGVLPGFFLSAIEKMIRMRPATESGPVDPPPPS